MGRGVVEDRRDRPHTRPSGRRAARRIQGLVASAISFAGPGLRGRSPQPTAAQAERQDGCRRPSTSNAGRRREQQNVLEHVAPESSSWSPIASSGDIRAIAMTASPPAVRQPVARTPGPRCPEWRRAPLEGAAVRARTQQAEPRSVRGSTSTWSRLDTTCELAPFGSGGVHPSVKAHVARRDLWRKADSEYVWRATGAPAAPAAMRYPMARSSNDRWERTA